MPKQSELIQILSLSAAEISPICAAFAHHFWEKPESLFERYLQQQIAGNKMVWIAYYNNDCAGYATLVFKSEYPPFLAANIPEIMDLNVLPSFRKRGIGSALLDCAEAHAAGVSPIVGIGVGLYGGPGGGYGAAQRLYIKRGYIPDGRGVSYNYAQAVPGETYPLDDDLVLWLTKKLK